MSPLILSVQKLHFAMNDHININTRQYSSIVFLKDKKGPLTNNQRVNSHRVIAIFICQFFNTNTAVGCADLLKK